MAARKKDRQEWSAEDLREVVSLAEAGLSDTKEPKAPRREAEAAKRPYRDDSLKESLNRLDAFVEEAGAGMLDEHLADLAKTSISAVREWRKTRRIPAPNPAQVLERMKAHVLVPGDPERAVHFLRERTGAATPGTWVPVQYVIRVPLEYSEFTRHVYHLHHHLGSDVATIARSLGVREKDVDLAIAAEAHHLRSCSKPCSTCGTAMDPAYGAYCSWACKKRRKKKT